MAFAEQAAVALQQGRLAAQAAEADRLAAGNSMRTALLAAVSHDLRTPLAGIKAASSALRSGDLDLTEADRAELVTTIDESADRLAGLVDNLLDMSRLQAGAVSPALAPTDLSAAVHRALAWLDDPDRDRVELDWPVDPPTALADPGLLERVIANLVGNAVRHSASGPVVVSAGLLHGQVELRIVDHGLGVPRADRERVFAPFQRLGDAPRGHGVGLGLAVARGLTEAMGGTLTAEDTPGGGLTMIVSLPAAPVSATSPPAPRRRGRPVSRVLVVDDDRQLLRALRITLRAAGHEVVTAADGRTALCTRPPPSTRTSSSSTSGCPTSTAPKYLPACAPGSPVRSWCCPPEPTAGTRSTRWTPGPTTT